MQVMDGFGKDNPDRVRISQGVPFFGPPRQVVDGLIEDLKGVGDALGSGATSSFSGVDEVRFGSRVHRYGPDLGMPALQEGLVEKLKRENGIDADASSEIVVSAGANMAFFVTLAAMVDPGDEVILLEPYYFNHRMALDLLGARTILAPCDMEYRPNVDAISKLITPRTKALLLVSPNNPCGTVYTRKELRLIRELCLDRRVVLVSDETYEYFVYDGARHISPASINADEGGAVSLFSFSKAFGMSGWRVGFAHHPPELRENILKVQDTTTICPTVASQSMALRCLPIGRKHLDSHLSILRHSRSLFQKGLAGLGGLVHVPPNEGGFYLFPRFQDREGLTSRKLAARLAEEFGVLTVPGEVFTSDPGLRLRVSFGNLDPTTAKKGMDRLVKGIRAIYSE